MGALTPSSTMVSRWLVPGLSVSFTFSSATARPRSCGSAANSSGTGTSVTSSDWTWPEMLSTSFLRWTTSAGLAAVRPASACHSESRLDRSSSSDRAALRFASGTLARMASFLTAVLALRSEASSALPSTSDCLDASASESDCAMLREPAALRLEAATPPMARSASSRSSRSAGMATGRASRRRRRGSVTGLPRTVAPHAAWPPRGYSSRCPC
mmetsp:Transcript_2636/g.6603  ORF Transcript_2636/g.6603 Transcript_2636/m.6603 type:complete len:213 (+) Transcript_2636:843-1481(+)